MPQILILLILALGCASAGFVGGVEVEGWKRDSHDKTILAEAAKLSQSVVTHDHTVEIRYVDRAVERDAQKERVQSNVADHAKLPDPPDCWLAPERVRDINAAFGLGDDQRTDAGPVPAPKPTGIRLPSGAGGVGGSTGLQIPRVLRPSGGAVGQGAGAPVSGNAGG